jgi:hypothetical protein
MVDMIRIITYRNFYRTPSVEVNGELNSNVNYLKKELEQLVPKYPMLSSVW